ncbi:hypothetical protein WN093_15540 [Gammaproteobacteria bacterium AS21]
MRFLLVIMLSIVSLSVAASVSNSKYNRLIDKYNSLGTSCADDIYRLEENYGQLHDESVLLLSKNKELVDNYNDLYIGYKKVLDNHEETKKSCREYINSGLDSAKYSALLSNYKIIERKYLELLNQNAAKEVKTPPKVDHSDYSQTKSREINIFAYAMATLKKITLDNRAINVANTRSYISEENRCKLNTIITDDEGTQYHLKLDFIAGIGWFKLYEDTTYFKIDGSARGVAFKEGGSEQKSKYQSLYIEQALRPIMVDLFNTLHGRCFVKS